MKKRIKESPDAIRIDSPDKEFSKKLNYNDSEAIPFIYIINDNNCIVDKKYTGKTHLDIRNDYDIPLKVSETLSGRIWIKSKYISFWKFPTNTSFAKKIITQLEKKLKLKILNTNFKVELPGVKTEFISVEKFIGKKISPSAEFKRTQHVKQGIFGRTIPKGVGSEKVKGKKSRTQLYQKAFTSEQVLRNIIQQLIKEEIK